MQITISILCPTIHCNKCKRMISFVESTIDEMGMKPVIEIVTEIDEIQKFDTWLLPSLYVNSEAVSRGFIPSKEDFIAKINKFLNEI